MHIDIFHDTVCPWCRIGKQNLKIALQDWQGSPITIQYLAFFLDPTIPAEGRDFRTHMLNKGGGRISLEQFFDGPRRAGEAVGLKFNFEAIQYAPNTLLSHQLIALAPPTLQEATIDAIYKAYFEEARNIGELSVLVDIAAEVGLDTDQTRQQLERGEMRDKVLSEVALAHQLGVTGVPLFVFNNKFALSGAQPPHVFRQVLYQVEELAS
ncbi:MAG: DsbA family oxidoreductase [Phototrophicales bacterium]|nr:MAG: DsbA family oxidoreductase [Phototrophicales bacterium]